jgi:hypothetical protein
MPQPPILALSAIVAAVPAVLCSRCVVSLGSTAAPNRRGSAAAFAWGAVGAALFSLIVELKLAALFIGALGERNGILITVGFGAPCIEELFKGLALLIPVWFFRRDVGTAADGAIHGALIGLGFAMTENIVYFYFACDDPNTGVRGLIDLLFVRTVIDGFGHAAYTGTTGAILGWARGRHGSVRQQAAALGLGLAALEHVLWNAGSIVLPESLLPNASLLSTALLEAQLVTVPALIALYAFTRRGRRDQMTTSWFTVRPSLSPAMLISGEFHALLMSHAGDRRSIAGRQV